MFNLFSSLLLSAATLPALVSAQYELLYPAPHGVFGADGATAFCGGYDTPGSTRASFPLSGGHILVKNVGAGGHTSTAILIATDASPSTFSAFNTTASGIQLPFVVPFFEYDVESDSDEDKDGDSNGMPDGVLCVPVNLGALGIGGDEGLGEGSEVTVQVMQVKGGENYYQCADLSLTSTPPTVPTEFECQNGTASGGHDDHDHDDHGHDDDDHDHDHEESGTSSSSGSPTGASGTSGESNGVAVANTLRLGGASGFGSVGGFGFAAIIGAMLAVLLV